MEGNAQNTQGLTSTGLTVLSYDQIIDGLYETTLDPRCLGQALRLVRELFKANYVTLILRAADEQFRAPMIVSGHIEGKEEDLGEVIYFSYHDESTPFGHLAQDQVFTNDDVMSDSKWSNSTYYLIHCHPYNTYHTLGVNISTPDGGTLRFRITRPKDMPKYSGAERAMCQLFVPHLRRTMHLSSLLDRRESLGNLYSQAIGRLSVATMVLDETGWVLERNLIAQEILNSNDGLKLVGGRLEATYPSDHRELQRVLRNAFAHQGAEFEGKAEAVSIARPSGLVSLGVVVEAIPSRELVEGKCQPAVLVYIRDAAGKSLASHLVTKQLFNLTPAETTLALELANGLSLEEAAELLTIRHNTARAHLRSIFSKTGVRRQTELVRVMLNSVMALGTPQQMMASQPLSSRSEHSRDND